jgi:hypothetical protein
MHPAMKQCQIAKEKGIGSADALFRIYEKFGSG